MCLKANCRAIDFGSHHGEVFVQVKKRRLLSQDTFVRTFNEIILYSIEDWVVSLPGSRPLCFLHRVGHPVFFGLVSPEQQLSHWGSANCITFNPYSKPEYQLCCTCLMSRDLTEATLTGGSLSLTAAFMIVFLLVAVCFV